MNDNYEEYEDPLRYDVENAGQGEYDLLYQWLSEVKGAIVDLACGTGRLTMPLAEAGLSMIGVDIHEGMLEIARQKSQRRNLDIEWLRQDALQFQLEKEAEAVIIVGNGFQHFLRQSDQRQLLSQVNSNLLMRGLLIFDLRFPSKMELSETTRDELAYSYTDQQGQKCNVYYESHYDPVEQIQHNTTYRVTELYNGDQVEDVAKINLRFTFPQELLLLLADSGFTLKTWYGSWKGAPVCEDNYSIVVVCEKTA